MQQRITKYMLLLLLLFVLMSHFEAFADNQDSEIFETKAAFEKQSSCILRDRYGFLWIGTIYGGLMKFNGMDTITYEKKKGGLSSNSISALLEDDDGNIWIGTDGGGLNQYNRKTGKFSNYKHDPTSDTSISDNSIPAWNSQLLCMDSKGFLWVGTANGLNRLNTKTREFERYFATGEPNTLSSNSITAIIKDKDGTIWIGTMRGLNSFDPDTKTFQSYLNDQQDPNSISGLRIRSLLVDKNNTLWVGTESSGLNQFDRTNGTFVKYQHDPNNPASIGGNTIWHLYEDQQHNIWSFHKMGVSFGISVLNPRTGVFKKYAHNPDDPQSIKTHFVADICYDPTLNSNFLLYGNGILDISYQRGRDKLFRLFTHDPMDSNSLSDTSVVPIIEDNNGNMWFGTFTGGLNKYDRKNGMFTHFKNDENDPTSIRANYVSALSKDRNGSLWLGYFGGSFSLFDPEKGEVQATHSPNFADPNSIMAGKMITTIIEDRNDPDLLWLSVLDKGISCFSKKAKSVVNYPIDGVSSIWHIIDDGTGNIWIPTIGRGLLKFDKQLRKVTKEYQHIVGGTDCNEADNLTYMHQGHDGVFWLSGLDCGLLRFDSKTENAQIYCTLNGKFPSNSLSGILEDKNGKLWIGTKDLGIVSFDSKTEKYRVYSKEDGLQSNTFFQLSRYMTSSGEMWMGGIKGVNSFYPDKIQDNYFVPQVFLTSLKQGGDPIELETSIEELKELKLDWRSNYFEFEYIGLSYVSPEKNQYKYKLEGHDDRWFFAGTKRFGRYTHLSPGIYNLRIMVSNNYGVWSETDKNLRIVVETPPGKTGFAYSLYALGFLILFASMTMLYAKKKREEIKLKNSEEKYRLLVENMPQRVFLKDREFKYISCNKNYAKDLGIEPEEIVGKDDFSFFPAELAEKYRADDSVVMINSTTVEFEETFMKNDEELTVYTVKSPVINGTGEVSGVLGIFWEIIKSKRACREGATQTGKEVQAKSEGGPTEETG